MSNGLEQVRPGDIISSELFNQVLARLADLEERVAKLESTPGPSQVAITGFEPETDAHVGEVLVVKGTGFIFPPIVGGVPTNNLRINNIPVTSFDAGDSSTERLSFIVPDAVGLSAPANVLITLTNAKGTAPARAYHMLPKQIVTAPAPHIDQIRPLDDSGATGYIFLNAIGAPGGTPPRIAEIFGDNFAPTPGGNTVKFIIPGTGNVYPHSGSAVVTNATPSHMSVEVPEMVEVPASGSIFVIVRVLVSGNPTPDSFEVSAIRM